MLSNFHSCYGRTLLMLNADHSNNNYLPNLASALIYICSKEVPKHNEILTGGIFSAAVFQQYYPSSRANQLKNRFYHLYLFHNLNGQSGLFMKY